MMSKIPKRSRRKYHKAMGDHHKFLSRISKTLYYGKLSATDRLSLPVTELASELFSEAQHGRSLERLHCNDAAAISRNACVSPCSLVLAMLYLDRLKACNPEYLQRIAPSELFLVSLMVSSKFLHDDGEEDEVFIDEWAASGNVSIKELIQLENNFLKAIDWEVYVSQLMFWKKFKELETSVARKEGLNRGWFTYTELQSLLKSIELYNLIQCIVSLTIILAATYTAAILTVAGSMFIVKQIPGNCLQNKNYVNVVNESNPSTNDMTLINTSKTDFICENKHLDAVNVLKTGIILASIKTKSYCNESNDDGNENKNVQNISWDWWTSPTMKWLTKTSKIIENFNLFHTYKINYYDRFLDISFVNSKMFELEDQIHKGTKIRLQDQMEQSWHKEWTDTIKNALFKRKTYSNYFGNVKS